MREHEAASPVQPPGSVGIASVFRRHRRPGRWCKELTGMPPKTGAIVESKGHFLNGADKKAESQCWND